MGEKRILDDALTQITIFRGLCSRTVPGNSLQQTRIHLSWLCTLLHEYRLQKACSVHSLFRQGFEWAERDGAHRECSFSNVNIRQRVYRIVNWRVNQLRDTISHFHFFQFWSFCSWFEELKSFKYSEEVITSSNWVYTEIRLTNLFFCGIFVLLSCLLCFAWQTLWIFDNPFIW